MRVKEEVLSAGIEPGRMEWELFGRLGGDFSTRADFLSRVRIFYFACGCFFKGADVLIRRGMYIFFKGSYNILILFKKIDSNFKKVNQEL